MNNKWKIAQYIALVATVIALVGIYISVSNPRNSIGAAIYTVGALIGIVSYFFGGFKQALSMSWKIARWGWVFFPFPVSLAAVILSFAVALMIFCFVPIIPVRKAYKESMRY
jgi:ABC-type antimicrobial peptide transport system permease subunit